MLYMNDEAYFARPKEVGDTVHVAWEPEMNHFLRGTNNSTGRPHED